MANKLIFTCNACGATGTIKVDDDFEITVCPCCGNCLDVENDDLDEYE
jgi:hypothetical protein